MFVIAARVVPVPSSAVPQTAGATPISRFEASQAYDKTQSVLSGSVALALISLIQIANFALTPNPFASVHSGKVGVEGGGAISEVPALHLAAAMAVALSGGVLWLLKTRGFVFEPWSILLASIYTIASLANGTYEERPQTPLFLAFFMVACGMLGKGDGVRGFEKERAIVTGFWFTAMLTVVGVVLAAAFPGRFGHFSVEISRQSRGEIALWIYTGTQYTAAAFAAAMIASRSPSGFSSTLHVTSIALALFVLLIHVGGANRYESFAFGMILLVSLVSRPSVAWVVLSVVSSIVALSWSRIVTFFLLAENSDFVEASNGRAELWTYFWSHLGDNPWVGVGDHFIGRAFDYGDGPNSEIGMLAIFVEKGWIFASLLSAFIIRATWRALVTLKERANPFACGIAAYVIGLSTKFWLSGGSWPVADVMFWYGVAFLNNFRAEDHRSVT
jgi:hypothetical protein